MNKPPDEQIHELLTRSNRRCLIECERALRVAAATLWQAPSGEIAATTVVCDTTDHEIDAVEALVAEIAIEYGLAASIQAQPGCCSVRFSWAAAEQSSVVGDPRNRSWHGCD
jgi:hypothetical protein